MYNADVLLCQADVSLFYTVLWLIHVYRSLDNQSFKKRKTNESIETRIWKTFKCWIRKFFSFKLFDTHKQLQQIRKRLNEWIE